MKRINYIAILSLGIIACSSCSSNEDPTEVLEKQFTEKTLAIGVADESTRLAITGDVNVSAPALVWENTDELAVWGKGSTDKYVFKYKEVPNPEYPNYAYFTCDDYPSNFEPEHLYIVYPNTNAVSYNETPNQFTVTIPSEQIATPNSFDPKAAICTGATDGAKDASVTLKHTCGFLKITITKAASSIVLESTGNYSLCGTIQVAPKSAGAAVTVTDESAKKVTLKPSGSSIEPGTYLFAILPSTSHPGFKCTVNYSDNTSVNKSCDKFAVSSAVIYNLGTAPESQN